MKCSKTLLASLLMLLLIPLEVHAKVYLVSVGVADYPGYELDLTLPAKDAKTMTWLYSKNAKVQYCQLLNQDATSEKIIAAMNKVYRMAGPNDIVVFFYSGHGYKGGFYVYDGELDYGEIRKAMAKSKSKNKMIFADACFSGKIRTDNGAADQTMAAARKANVMLFLSSRSNETSIERRDMNNGFFTTYLQKGLRGGADVNRDRVVTAKELFNYVSKNVAEISDDMQHPVMWGSFPDNMTVMSWK